MRTASAAAIILAASALPAAAQCGEQPTGPAAGAIAKVSQYLGAETFERFCTFYGDYTGDGAPDALAIIYFVPPDWGNSNLINVRTYRNVGGKYRADLVEYNVYGQEPRDVRFERGRIALTTTMPGPNDPRCCPTLPQAWTIAPPP